MSALPASIFAFAIAHAGLPVAPATHAPRIVFASDCAINRLANGIADNVPCKLVQPRDAFATYDDIPEIVYMPFECKGFKTLYCRGVLAHEFTHFLQDRVGIIDTANRNGCLASVEPLAYRVGNAYLIANGGKPTISDIGIAIMGQCHPY